MQRRQVLRLTVAGLATLSLHALAQQERRVRRIGYLSSSTAQSNVPWLAAFREGMAALRWVEGRDYVIDARYAGGVFPVMSGLAAELVAAQPDLLLTTGEGAIIPLAQQTKNIPIVFTIATNPLWGGLVASLQRPGGNMTGLTTLSGDIAAKWLQLLKEALPRINHVAVLFDAGSIQGQLREIEAAAPRLGVSVTPLELRQPADIEPAFKRGAALGVQAYIVTQAGSVNSQRQVIVDHTLRLKVPNIAGTNEFAEAGGLMSYSNSARENFRRAATYADKILKGASPGELPIEQPTKVELVLNLKTAKAMGITFPQSLLLRADRVIE